MRKVLIKGYDDEKYPDSCNTEEDILKLYDSLEEVDEDKLNEYIDKNVKYIKYKNFLYFTYFDTYRNIDVYGTVQIVEVDTTKLWLITECNGNEYLKYYKLSDNNELIESE